eukprot:TRINITY_DN10549_c0_g1_i1.p1 TRINITY_DN10549_c0_g1~~TRINITY_DN10549_c0_g1_i1.p1  ORF type:complete len:160 (+),score=56.93 TRINITY_DN10549_c0_g1_i1:73-552(+)
MSSDSAPKTAESPKAKSSAPEETEKKTATTSEKQSLTDYAIFLVLWSITLASSLPRRMFSAIRHPISTTQSCVQSVWAYASPYALSVWNESHVTAVRQKVAENSLFKKAVALIPTSICCPICGVIAWCTPKSATKTDEKKKEESDEKQEEKAEVHEKRS